MNLNSGVPEMEIKYAARTQKELFEIFKVENPNMSWSRWVLNKWTESLRICKEHRFKIIPIGYRTKKPQSGFKWATKKFKYDDALIHVEKGNNIAIVAGPSHLVMLDYDAHVLDAKISQIKTMFIVTPRGLCFLTEEPYDEMLFEKLKKRYPKFDTPRVDVMYALAPLSITCTKDVKNKHQCEIHDYRIREWMRTDNLITFKSFVKEAVQ